MASVTIQEAQARLPELIRRLTPGDEVVITENDRPVARLVQSPAMSQWRRQLGTMKGTVLKMAAEFDAPLEDFREYMD